jgi:uncharacterized protein YjgD (DUF1641 family)
MENNNMLDRMNILEEKLDLVLDYVNQQRLRSEAIEDLVADMSLIGKDVYNSSVAELEKQSVELDPDDLRQLGLNLLKNIRNINETLELLDSMMDLKKDAAPIFNELILEFTKNLHTLESKGYFDVAKELGLIADKVVTHLKTEDLRKLGDQIPLIIQTMNRVTQPEILHALDHAAEAFGEIQTGEIPKYSLWKAMREINSPEARSTLGFMILFMKKLAKTNKNI